MKLLTLFNEIVSLVLSDSGFQMCEPRDLKVLSLYLELLKNFLHKVMVKTVESSEYSTGRVCNCLISIDEFSGFFVISNLNFKKCS